MISNNTLLVMRISLWDVRRHLSNSISAFSRVLFLFKISTILWQFTSVHMLVVCLYTLSMCVLFPPKTGLHNLLWLIWVFKLYFPLSVNHPLLGNQVLLLSSLLLLYYTKHWPYPINFISYWEKKYSDNVMGWVYKFKAP